MIAILTPARDMVQATFAYDLAQLIKKNPDTEFSIQLGTFLVSQRTDLVEWALGTLASHVLFIDSDMRFPPDAIERLLRHDKDIIGANCRHRRADKWTIGKSSAGKKGIEQVEGIGFGVTLIKTSVFGMPKPWFATPYDGDQLISDDIFFCYKAKEAGFKIWVDHDLSQEVKHTGQKEFGI